MNNKSIGMPASKLYNIYTLKMIFEINILNKMLFCIGYAEQNLILDSYVFRFLFLNIINKGMINKDKCWIFVGFISML